MYEKKSKIGAIILAAGMSTRMGRPKMLLQINGKPVFFYVCEVAIKLGLEPIVIICGDEFGKIKSEIQLLKNITSIYNPQFKEGMSTSLKLGIKKMSDLVDGVFIFLADQPLIPTTVVQSLITCFKKSPSTLIVRPTYQGMEGHPVLFSHKLFPEFEHIQGDEGGRRIIRRYAHSVKTVPFSNSYWGKDIDTLDDFKQIKKYIESLC